MTSTQWALGMALASHKFLITQNTNGVSDLKKWKLFVQVDVKVDGDIFRC